MENQNQNNIDATNLSQLASVGKRIVNIKPVGNKRVYDITVDDSHHYILDNGVVTHNTGIYYSADNIFIIGRQQDKTDKTINGYSFILNVEKSRYVKEKAKIPIDVMYQGGINKWSGFLELALEGGYVAKPKNGWYQIVDRSTGELVGKMYREDDIDTNSEIWLNILKSTDFAKFIEDKYILPVGKLLANEVVLPEGALDTEDDDDIAMYAIGTEQEAGAIGHFSED